MATSAWRPSASISFAVVSRLPGSGDVSERFTVDECSSGVPSASVRAHTTTSYPRRASAREQPRPMPRLAPVTIATLVWFMSPPRVDSPPAGIRLATGVSKPKASEGGWSGPTEGGPDRDPQD